MKEELTMKEEFSLVYQHKHKQPIEKNKRKITGNTELKSVETFKLYFLP